VKLPTTLCLIFITALGLIVARGKTAPAGSPQVEVVRSHSRSAGTENVFDLTDFGAVGDGVTDDGPALQSALDAMGESGGGTLFVPAGRYAIITPVQKNFTGLAFDISILGVESSTPVPPPNSGAQELTRGLDLLSEFAPRSGEQGISINITGLQSLLIKDITFIGTPGVNTDALITLALNDIWEATIRHSEFYGLSTLREGGAIVHSVRSHLKVEQSVFLGCTGNSAVGAPVVQNLDWKGIIIENAVFVDYGQRPELFGKLGLAAPASWVNIGNAAVVESDSPRREAVIRNVFFDEGALNGLASLPNLSQSAPIDLLYVTGLYMNVTNLGASGNCLYGAKGVLIEKSHYGWSHNADAAIKLLSVGEAILDQVECVASADRIRGDSATGTLTVIDSVYNHLDSLAQTTRVITTNAPDEDPVQYVRQQFGAALGRDPDPAAHFYWSDEILQCADNSQCVDAKRAALGDYLAVTPQEKFAVSGQVVDENGAGMAGVTVALGGSQNVTTETDTDGRYQFSNLPTSGVYSVIPSRRHYTLSPVSYEIVTTEGNQIFNSAATFNHHAIGGRVADGAGNALADVTVTLSGSQSMTATTGADGEYLFADLPAEGNYTVTPGKTSYAFSPANPTFNDLDADQTQNFAGNFVAYTIAGIVVDINNNPIPGATVTLSGSQNRTTTSDSAGGFSFTGIPSEGNYTVSPTLIDSSFSPLWRTYNCLAANQYDPYVGSQPAGNPIGDAQFFVRQHYRDFLNREPDADGLAFWSGQITSCGTDASCVADRRISVSAAFFLSIEFQETGFLVHRLYKASFGRMPDRVDEFLLDTRTIGEGVVVNAPGWQALLETNKTEFIETFVARSQFSEAYPLILTPAEFVNLLNAKTGGALSSNDVAAAVAEFQGAATSDSVAARARALRRVAENETFSQRELNPAFVLMQYFGYLQRNPNEAPDTNLDGYNFWLHKLDEFAGDFRRAEMVKSFLVSAEYRARFGAP
jgi:hypothetical protein